MDTYYQLVLLQYAYQTSTSRVDAPPSSARGYTTPVLYERRIKQQQPDHVLEQTTSMYSTRTPFRDYVCIRRYPQCLPCPRGHQYNLWTSAPCMTGLFQIIKFSQEHLRTPQTSGNTPNFRKRAKPFHPGRNYTTTTRVLSILQQYSSSMQSKQ